MLLRVCWLDTYTGLLSDSVIQTTLNVWQSRESLLRGLRNPRAYYAGWVDGGRIVGMVSAGMIDPTKMKVFQMYVLPSHQRKGIGSRLMDSAVQHFPQARSATLEVTEGNAKGISFYRKYGFDYPGTTLVEIDGERVPCLVGKMDLHR